MRSAWLEADLPEHLVVGTSSFSWPEWHGPFYPADLPAGERIAYYATQFPVVEIDATFYAMPARSLMSGWALKTPDSFRFALKVPKAITHDAGLVGTEAATAQFLDVTSALGPRRGPLLLQFPYVAKRADPAEYEHGDGFRARLAAWLAMWAGHAPWVVEVRNSGWLTPSLFRLLRDHDVPLALTAYYTMPSLRALQGGGQDPLTGPFAYVRFLGDHRRLDARNDELVKAGAKTAGYNEIIWDREDELRGWAEALLPVIARRHTWCFFNNHYAGFGPASARLFARLWTELHGS
jgi:uncharacterized protein YecE (DUF72 family)